MEEDARDKGAVSATCPVAINNLRDVARAAREGFAYVNVHTVAHPSGEVRGQLEEDVP